MKPEISEEEVIRGAVRDIVAISRELQQPNVSELRKLTILRDCVKSANAAIVNLGGTVVCESDFEAYSVKTDDAIAELAASVRELAGHFARESLN